jgi:glutathionylspermidine synthase
MILACCKWDPQVGDVGTLARFPIILRRDAWTLLVNWAESLAAEARDAEKELLGRPDLFGRLGIPRSAAKALTSTMQVESDTTAGRVIRFDFHWTTSGWRISEANADVPGGFTESSSFTWLIARHYPAARPAGNPVRRWANLVKQLAGEHGTVALLVAPGYMEDHQIVEYLAGRLRKLGVSAHVCQPAHLKWTQDGRFARMNCDWHCGPVQVVVRFYQAEWLAALGRKVQWRNLFCCGGATRVINPGSAMLIESKRFPLVWDELQTRVPTWRRLLPETRDPREAPWRTSDQWILKGAFGNTGDEVAMRDSMNPELWRKFARQAWWNPRAWAAQRRFEPISLETDIGPVYPCIGVYTIDGTAAGIYGRISKGPVIDYAAIDVAVLVERGIHE